MQRKLLEECEVGDWVTIGALMAENEAVDFGGELTLPDGQVRRFKEEEVPCKGGTDFVWKRVV